MKTHGKILVVVLVTLMLTASIAANVSAEEFTPSEEPVIYFEVPETWIGIQKVFCHIYDCETSESFAPWQSKKERCTLVEGNLYAYDISKVGILEEDKCYDVIFSSDVGYQTYEMCFSTECFGDTAYCDGTVYEISGIEVKFSPAAFWRNQDSEKYGPVCRVNDIGMVIGTAPPLGQTKEDVFAKFLKESLHTSQFWSGKTDQRLIDDIKRDLGLTSEQVLRILTETDYIGPVEWNGEIYHGSGSPSVEATYDETFDEILPVVIYGDADKDTKVTIKDATFIQKYTADIVSEIDRSLADVNIDGAVNVKDATVIQKYLAGFSVNPWIGMPIG